MADEVLMKRALKIKANIQEKRKKIYSKNKIVAIAIFFTISIATYMILLILYNGNILEQKALDFHQNGQYRNAESCYRLNTKIKKLFSVTLKSKKDRDIYTYFESKEEMIKCLIERGEITKAIKEYQKFAEEVKKHCPQDEEMSNLINLQIANCYSILGIYGKSIPIYEQLKNWYPQNLIQAYIDIEDYERAKNILETEKVQSTIAEGEDLDAVALGYTLLKYYKAIGRYDLADNNYTKEAPTFETDITNALNQANLKHIKKDYEKAEEIYEELLTSSAFSQTVRHKIQLQYALLLYEEGKSYQAEQAIENVIKEQGELYELSPEVICANYTAAKIYVEKAEYYLANAQKKFDRLKIPAESYFYKNLDYFCKINSRF